MTTDEPPAHKDTVDESDSVTPDATPLLLEGVSPGEITVDLLTAVMDTCEDEDLPVDGVSVLRTGTDQ